MNRQLKSITLSFVIFLMFMASVGCSSQIRGNVTRSYDIVIYGGGPQAVAAALKASDVTHNQAKILMVVQEDKLGTTWTSGDLNMLDFASGFTPKHMPKSIDKSYHFPQGGSIYAFDEAMSPFFPPNEMAKYLASLIAKHPNISVDYQTEVRQTDMAGLKIENVVLQRLTKDNNGYLVFDGSASQTVTAPLFIDASETGRLVRISKFDGIVGRADRNPDQAQMAATLMFEVKGLDWVSHPKTMRHDIHSSITRKDSMGFWSASPILDTPEVRAWNAAHPMFSLKPFNGAQDGYGPQNKNTPFWMNMLLIYGVDGSKAWCDKVANDGLYPNTPGVDPETARDRAIKEIEKPEFLKALRSIKGLEHVELVTHYGKPAVGDELYLRESIHAANDASNNLFALDEAGVKNADEKYLTHEIGLGFYQFDSNSYTKGESLYNPLPKEAWYIPYETLLTPSLSNVLIPGYSANIDSFSWTAMRVYPNLTVLGDAAGVAAGLSSKGNFVTSLPTDRQIRLLQTELRLENAILDK